MVCFRQLPPPHKGAYAGRCRGSYQMRDARSDIGHCYPAFVQPASWFPSSQRFLHASVLHASDSSVLRRSCGTRGKDGLSPCCRCDVGSLSLFFCADDASILKLKCSPAQATAAFICSSSAHFWHEILLLCSSTPVVLEQSAQHDRIRKPTTPTTTWA